MFFVTMQPTVHYKELAGGGHAPDRKDSARIRHPRAWLTREESRPALFGAQISPVRVGRFDQADLRSARDLLDLALASNRLVDIIKFLEVEEPCRRYSAPLKEPGPFF